MDEQNKTQNVNQAGPVQQPLRTEDVNAATLPLHVGVDRVAAARQAQQQSETFPDPMAHVAPQKTPAPLQAGGALSEADISEKTSATGEIAALKRRLAELERGVGQAAPVEEQLKAENVNVAADGTITPPRVTAVAEVKRTPYVHLTLELFPEELRQHLAAIDDRGLVRLNGLPDTLDPQTRATFFAISEIADYLPESPKAFVALNTQPAEGIWAPCRELVDGQAKGELIADTMAVPATTVHLMGKAFNCATVEGVLGYIMAPHLVNLEVN